MRLDHTPEPSAYRPRSHRDHANISRSVIGQFKGSAQESPPRENELWQARLGVGQSADLPGGADPRKGSALIGPSYRLTKTEPCRWTGASRGNSVTVYVSIAGWASSLKLP